MRNLVESPRWFRTMTAAGFNGHPFGDAGFPECLRVTHASCFAASLVLRSVSTVCGSVGADARAGDINYRRRRGGRRQGRGGRWRRPRTHARTSPGLASATVAAPGIDLFVPKTSLRLSWLSRSPTGSGLDVRSHPPTYVRIRRSCYSVGYLASDEPLGTTIALQEAQADPTADATERFSRSAPCFVVAGRTRTRPPARQHPHP